MTYRQPWEFVKYSFKIDSNELQYVSPARDLFPGLLKSDVDLVGGTATANATTYDCEDESKEAKKLSVTMGLSGGFKGFELAAQMSVQSKQSSEVKKRKRTVEVQSQKYKVIMKPTGKELLGKMNDSLKHMSCDEIVNNFGIFYSTGGKLGGMFKFDMIMESSKGDTESSVDADFKAAYNGLFTASATGGISSINRQSASACQITAHAMALGGDPTIWLGLTDMAKKSDIQQRWAASMSDANLFFYDMQLEPISNLVKLFDPKKAQELDSYIKRQYSKHPMLFGVCKDDLDTSLVYRIKVKASGRFLHENGLGDKLVSTRCEPADDYTRFTLKETNDDCYQIMVKAHGRHLHVQGTGDKLVSTRHPVNDDFTKFYLEYQTDGSYRIKVKATHMYLHEDGKGDKLVSTRYQPGDDFTRFYLVPDVDSSSKRRRT